MSSVPEQVLRSRRGFTLLESIVALAIISLVAVGTLTAVGGQLRSMDHAQRTTEAVALADERMLAIRLLASADLQSLPDSIASGRFLPPFNRYTWRATVQPVSGEVGLNDVAVQIDWSEGAYTLASRVYRTPPVGAGSQPEAGGGGLQGGSIGNPQFDFQLKGLSIGGGP